MSGKLFDNAMLEAARFNAGGFSRARARSKRGSGRGGEGDAGLAGGARFHRVFFKNLSKGVID